jgi:hypothetical protein
MSLLKRRLRHSTDQVAAVDREVEVAAATKMNQRDLDRSRNGKSETSPKPAKYRPT